MVKIQFSTVSCLFCITTIAFGIIHSTVSLTCMIIVNRIYFFPLLPFYFPMSNFFQDPPVFTFVLFIFSSCFFAFLFLLFFFFIQKEIDIEKVFKQQFGQQFNLDRKDSSVPLHYHNSKLCPTLQNYSYWEVQYGYYFETKLYRWLVEWQMTNESCLQLNNKRKNIHDVTLKYYMYNN